MENNGNSWKFLITYKWKVCSWMMTNVWWIEIKESNGSCCRIVLWGWKDGERRLMEVIVNLQTRTTSGYVGLRRSTSVYAGRWKTDLGVVDPDWTCRVSWESCSRATGTTARSSPRSGFIPQDSTSACPVSCFPIPSTRQLPEMNINLMNECLKNDWVCVCEPFITLLLNIDCK